MTEPLLGLVVGTLDRIGATHALVGAAALAAHGVARSTYDTDLMTTDLRVLDSARWTELAARAGCQVSVRRGDADDPLAGVVRISRSDERDVDVVVGRWPWQTEAIGRAGQTELRGIGLRVVTAPDLVLLKLDAGGTQDLWDVEQLLAAGHREAIVADVESRLLCLPSNAWDAWARVTGR